MPPPSGACDNSFISPASPSGANWFGHASNPPAFAEYFTSSNGPWEYADDLTTRRRLEDEYALRLSALDTLRLELPATAHAPVRQGTRYRASNFCREC